MLILSRKVNESIVIDGRIIVKVVRVEGDQIKLGIQAPRDVPVHRQEIFDEIQRTDRESLTEQGHPQPHLDTPAQCSAPLPVAPPPPTPPPVSP
jgi:carbon storage regulator